MVGRLTPPGKNNQNILLIGKSEYSDNLNVLNILTIGNVAIFR